MSWDYSVTTALNLAPVFCFLAVTMGCVCGCRKQIPKNELLGLAGMVKLRDPDYSSPPPLLSVSSHNAASDTTTSNSQTRVNGSAGGAVSRSLPDLPVGPTSSNAALDADTTSDLYATLDLDGEGNKTRDGMEEEPRPQTPGSPVYPPPSEERYARVGSEERIPAASAIAGIVPANPDLPYMTPPPQPNFSGDSHDSHKGYTSISVREPLSRILPCGRGSGGGIRSVYATLSDVDSSDDMYAAIEDSHPSDTYARIGGGGSGREYATSESETYAQIGPRPSLTRPEVEEEEEGGGEGEVGDYGSGSDTYAQIAPRQPHSSHQPHPQPLPLTTLGSDADSPVSLRKEKREANSPLPEPPSPTTATLDTPHSPLDAMYAKVNKKHKTSPSPPATPVSPPLQVMGVEETMDRHYESVDRAGAVEPPYEKIQEKRTVQGEESRCISPADESQCISTSSPSSSGCGAGTSTSTSSPSTSSAQPPPDTNQLYSQVNKPSPSSQHR